MLATGTFEISLVPQSPAEGDTSGIGHMLITKKTYEGDLEANSVGQMLAYRTATEGSAGYVAIELVTGTLGGGTGSFALQHSGLMNQGETSLDLIIIPDSGTDGLAGIVGTATIDIDSDGTHHYTIEYRI